ncbi:unnamed protein product [Miscanthus lutarioriparius]|uniref:Uncharacterized protein n=1 Tax=Miscanthus lutarioriparius TaxID=422564 RepID=A0A811SD57_9POAL|nr:unnamed protein product [Miscanthus lutarioriparius]
MGNCLNTASKRSHHGMLPEEEESLSQMRRIRQLLREVEDDYGYEAVGMHSVVEEEEEVVAVAPAVAAEGLKVKIVLTRGELEWLMAQLKSGEQRLEDVLQHMQAAKGVGGGGGSCAGADKQAGWRPRLESILECPETQS